MRIVGFDPGTIATGYGVVSFDAGCLIFESCGVFRPPAALSLSLIAMSSPVPDGSKGRIKCSDARARI